MIQQQMLKKNSSQTVGDNNKIEDMIAIQIVSRYLNILGHNWDIQQNLQQWAKDTRLFVSTFISFRQFYKNRIEQVHQLLIKHKYQSPFKSYLNVSSIRFSNSSQSQQDETFLEILYNTSLKKIKNYDKNLLELVEANPTLVFRAILKSELFRLKYPETSKYYQILKKIFSSIRKGKVHLQSVELSELYYLLGTVELKLKYFYCFLKSFQDSLSYNSNNMRAHKMIIQLYLENNQFIKCLNHIETHRKSLAYSKYFLSIQALANFFHEDNYLGFNLLHFIKEEINADPEKEREYWYFNYCWGYLKYCMMEYEEAYQYFQRQLKMDQKDVNVVKMMTAIRFKQQKYQSAYQLLSNMCLLSHSEVNVDASTFLGTICKLKTSKPLIKNIRERISFTIQHSCFQSEFLRYMPLYFGLLYIMGDYEQAIKQYERIPFVRLSVFPIISSFFTKLQLNIVMLQCYSKIGQDENVLTILQKLQLLVSNNAEDSIFFCCQLYHHLLFLINFCFQKDRLKEGRFFAEIMKQNITSMIKGFRIQDDTKIKQSLELPKQADVSSLLFRGAYFYKDDFEYFD